MTDPDPRDIRDVAIYERCVEDAEQKILEWDAGPEGQEAADIVGSLSYKAQANAAPLLDDDELRRMTADLRYCWQQCEKETVSRKRKRHVATIQAGGA